MLIAVADSHAFIGMVGERFADSGICMKLDVFSYVMSRVLEESYHHFGGIVCLRNGDSVLSNNMVAHLRSLESRRTEALSRPAVRGALQTLVVPRHTCLTTCVISCRFPSSGR
jgi:hypothetical protein